MTVETLWVNADTDTETPKWGTVGSNPYLDASDSDYIDVGGSKNDQHKSGDFSFPTTGASGTINSVNLQFRDKCVSPADNDSYSVWVYDGLAWHYITDVFPSTTGFSWEAMIDVSAILGTVAKINAAKVYVIYNWNLGNSAIYVSQLTRIVDYTPSVVTPTARGDGLVWIVSTLKPKLPKFPFPFPLFCFSRRISIERSSITNIP